MSADDPKIFKKSKPVCETVMKERGICAGCAAEKGVQSAQEGILREREMES